MCRCLLEKREHVRRHRITDPFCTTEAQRVITKLAQLNINNHDKHDTISSSLIMILIHVLVVIRVCVQVDKAPTETYDQRKIPVIFNTGQCARDLIFDFEGCA